MGAASVTWLGHSTVLIETGGVRLLTDPVLGRRVAHLTRRAPRVDPRKLGPVEGVLLSHLHRDHLNGRTLRAIGTDVPVVGPAGHGRARTQARGPRARAGTGDRAGRCARPRHAGVPQGPAPVP